VVTHRHPPRKKDGAATECETMTTPYVTVSRGLATEMLHRVGWPTAGGPTPRLAPPVRPAQEHKRWPAPLLTFLTTHGSRFAPTHPLNFSVDPRRLRGAVGSFAAAPGQTQEEEYQDRVENEDGEGEEGWRWRTEMGKVVRCLSALICLFACTRRRLLCIWFQWAFVGLRFADAIVPRDVRRARLTACRVRDLSGTGKIIFEKHMLVSKLKKQHTVTHIASSSTAASLACGHRFSLGYPSGPLVRWAAVGDHHRHPPQL
jgi:hypothetical protein